MTTTPGDSSRNVKLQPGERLAANGVHVGSGAHPEIPRHGADETDLYQPADEGDERCYCTYPFGRFRARQ